MSMSVMKGWRSPIAVALACSLFAAACTRLPAAGSSVEPSAVPGSSSSPSASASTDAEPSIPATQSAEATSIAYPPLSQAVPEATALDLDGAVWVGKDYNAAGSPVVVGRVGDRIYATTDSAAGYRADFGAPVTWTPLADGQISVSQFDFDTERFAEIYLTDPIDESIRATLGPAARSLYLYGVDLGLIRVDIPSKSTAALVQPVAADAVGPGPRGIGEVIWSPDGAMLATSTCSLSRCVSNIAEVDGSTVTQVDDFLVLAITGTTVIGIAGDPSARSGFSAMDLTTAKVVPIANEIATAWDAWALPDGRFVAYGNASKGDGIAVVTLASGGTTYPAHLVITLDGDSQIIVGWWVDSEHVLLAPNRGGFDDTIANADPLDLLNLTTGQVVEDAVPIQGVPAFAP